MENRSFRDILAQFLEEKTEVSPRKSASPAPETPLFHWENPELKPRHPKNPYPKAPARPKPMPEVKAAPPEPKWRISELNAVEQQQIRNLVQMGATEINGEISLSVLKKAHRRLAKRFHPDMQANEMKRAGNLPPETSSQGKFLALQSIYEVLSESLSERASGSESASAPASPRPAAA